MAVLKAAEVAKAGDQGRSRSLVELAYDVFRAVVEISFF